MMTSRLVSGHYAMMSLVAFIGCMRPNAPSPRPEMASVESASVVPPDLSLRVLYQRSAPFPAAVCPGDFAPLPGSISSGMLGGYQQFRPGERLAFRGAREGAYRVSLLLFDNTDNLGGHLAEVVQEMDISDRWASISIRAEGKDGVELTMLVRSMDEDRAIRQKRAACSNAFLETKTRQPWMPPSAGQKSHLLRTVPASASVELDITLSPGTTVPPCPNNYYRWPSNCDPMATGGSHTVWPGLMMARGG
jgi:hypothetical protein